MRSRRVSPLLAALVTLLALASCEKRSKDKAGSADAPEDPTPRDTTPLWKLAPANTVTGLVMADGAGPVLEEAYRATSALVGEQPGENWVMREVEYQRSMLLFDPFDDTVKDKLGLDLSRGMASFFLDNGEVVNVLTFEHSEAAALVGLGQCKAIANGRSICTRNPETLAAIGKPGKSRVLAKLESLPDRYRGEIEIIDLRPTVAAELAGHLGRAEASIVVFTATDGVLVTRYWLQAPPRSTLAESATKVPRTLQPEDADATAGLVYLRLPATLVDPARLPRSIPGVDLERDVLGNMTGEALLYAPVGTELTAQVVLGLREPSRLAKPLRAGCPMLGLAAKGVTSRPKGDACALTVDLGELDLPTPIVPAEPIEALVTLDDRGLVVTVGELPENPRRVAAGPGQELATGEWNVAVWSRGMSLLSWGDDLPPARRRTDGLPPLQRQLVWGLAHLEELGYGIALRDDGLHVMVRARTWAADGAKAWERYAAQVRRYVGGEDTDSVKEVRKGISAPLLARQHEVGDSGLIVGTAGLGATMTLAGPLIAGYVRFDRLQGSRGAGWTFESP